VSKSELIRQFMRDTPGSWTWSNRRIKQSVESKYSITISHQHLYAVIGPERNRRLRPNDKQAQLASRFLNRMGSYSAAVAALKHAVELRRLSDEK
jgi:hypothetical protein